MTRKYIPRSSSRSVQSRTPDDVALLHRRRYLEHLRNVSDMDNRGIGWGDINAIRHIDKPRHITTFLLKLGFIETQRFHDVLCARITLAGRGALASGNLFSAMNYKWFKVPTDVYEGLEKLAKQLKMINPKEKKGSPMELIRHILAREDAFKRWFRHVNAEELPE